MRQEMTAMRSRCQESWLYSEDIEAIDERKKSRSDWSFCVCKDRGQTLKVPKRNAMVVSEGKSDKRCTQWRESAESAQYR